MSEQGLQMRRSETIRQATRATRLAYARALLARIEARLGLRPVRIDGEAR